MTHGSLFSGIGGFDLAAEWMGWDNLFHVECDPFCRQVLAHHFPNSKPYEDIKTFDATTYAGGVDIISGGFPCQPFSAAGNRRGTSDGRYLWPEMFRVIREACPTYVVAENVRGLISWNEGLVFDTVCVDLESEGYEVFPVVLPAAGVNAPHRRDRIWVVAYSDDKGRAGGFGQVQGTHGEVSKWHNHAQPCYAGSANATNANSERRERGVHEERPQETTRHVGACSTQQTAWQDFPTFAPVCGGDDGLPKRLDGITFSKWRRESIKAYGNAICPQVAYQIFKALQNE